MIVPGVITREEVGALRDVIDARFSLPQGQRLPGDDDGFLFDIFNRCTDVGSLLFRPIVLESLRQLMGSEPVLMREGVAQREQYGHWHKDTTTAERAGARFVTAPDLRFAEVAFYLQDNDDSAGGGLEVAPGSHREVDEFARRGLIDRAVGKFRGGPRAPVHIERVESRAGDMVVFDFRISHRATRPLIPRGNRPDKLALFQAVSSNSPHVDLYHQFLEQRPGYDYLTGFRWSDEMVRSARDAGIRLG